jgi:hypothetical protein
MPYVFIQGKLADESATVYGLPLDQRRFLELHFGTPLIEGKNDALRFDTPAFLIVNRLQSQLNYKVIGTHAEDGCSVWTMSHQ